MQISSDDFLHGQLSFLKKNNFHSSLVRNSNRHKIGYAPNPSSRPRAEREERGQL